MQVVSEAVRWKYYKLANGEYSIYIRMTNYRKVEYIKTQMSCLEANWDEEKGMPKPEHPQYSALTKKIDQIKEDIDFELKLAKKKGESLTLVELKSRVENEEPKTPAVQSKKIFELYDEIIDQKEKAGKPGASDIFKFNKTVFFELFDEKDKFFTSFTEKDFLKIDPYLDTLKTESTKSLYLRTFYRVWNIAIKRKYCPETLHPKFIVDYKPYKRIKTKKRAIPREYITLIENLQLPYNSRLFRSQQFAIFIYYARGINFKDFAQLKKIIKPGGSIFIAVPNYTSYDAGIYKSYWAAYDVPRHLYHFSPVSMKQLLEKNGLKLHIIKPMWYDSFYISMLSEQYKTGHSNIVKAFFNGTISNLKTVFNNEYCSSLIYVVGK